MKKMIPAAAILLLAVAACSVKTKYEINGTSSEEGSYVYLNDMISREPIDSAIVTGGKFSLNGKADKDALLAISDETGGQAVFFNDGNALQIGLEESTVSGSELNEKVCAANKELKSTFGQIMDLMRTTENLPEEEAEAVTEKAMKMYEGYIGSIKQIIDENKDNILPAALMPSILGALEDDELDEIIAGNPAFVKHPYAKYVLDFKAKQDEKMKAADEAKQKIVGEQFLDLEEPDTDGNMHKLSEYVGKGKWVLVDFWASWCGPCKGEMPNVVNAYKAYHDKGFDIVGLSFDNDKDAWVKAIGEWEMPWIHLSDLKGWDTLAHEVYSVNSIPDNLLIDPEGKIVARCLRGEDLASKLAEVFGK